MHSIFFLNDPKYALRKTQCGVSSYTSTKAEWLEANC